MLFRSLDWVLESFTKTARLRELPVLERFLTDLVTLG
jgi:hypothetical protein